MFSISREILDPEALKMSRPDCGALVTFEGWVRNHNEGKAVTSLEYEIYHSMALKEGQKIIDEALEKFAIYDAVCIHREGHLALADIAVYVAVASAHRGAAFDACQYIIDKYNYLQIVPEARVSLRRPVNVADFYPISQAY